MPFFFLAEFYLILATVHLITPQCCNIRGVPELFYTEEVCHDERHAVWFVLLYDVILEGLKPAGVK